MYSKFLTTLKVEHRDHQQEAVEWAVKIEKKTRNQLFNEGANGGFIADDMGLGKTYQSASYILGMFYRDYVESQSGLDWCAAGAGEC